MTAGGRVITPGYNLLSELLSLQKTPYVILLAQSADVLMSQTKHRYGVAQDTLSAQHFSPDTL